MHTSVLFKVSKFKCFIDKWALYYRIKQKHLLPTEDFCKTGKVNILCTWYMAQKWLIDIGLHPVRMQNLMHPLKKKHSDSKGWTPLWQGTTVHSIFLYFDFCGDFWTSKQTLLIHENPVNIWGPLYTCSSITKPWNVESSAIKQSGPVGTRNTPLSHILQEEIHITYSLTFSPSLNLKHTEIFGHMHTHTHTHAGFHIPQ